MKLVLVLLSSFWSFIFFAQTNENLFSPEANWKTGDERFVEIVHINYVYIDDSLMSRNKTTTSYTLTVLDTLHRNTITRTTSSVIKVEQLLAETEPSDYLERFVYLAEQRMANLTYHLLMEKTTGEVIEILNPEYYDEQLSKVITQTVTDFNTYIPSMDSSFIADFTRYMKGSRKNILDEVLDQSNQLFEAYKYTFILNETLEKKTTVSNIKLLENVRATEIPAHFKISAHNDEHVLYVNSWFNYDQEAFLAAAKEVNPIFEDVEPKELELKEKKSFELDLNTNWLLNFSTEIVTGVPGIKIVQTKSIYFTE